MIRSEVDLMGSYRQNIDPRNAAALESGKLISTVLNSPPGVEVQAIMRCSPESILKLLTNYEEMPEHIYGLERAEILSSTSGTRPVRFTMKLPFPVGTIQWTNIIEKRSSESVHSLEWKLVGGDLEVNDGRLIMTNHNGLADVTYARYQVRVQSRTRMPKSAERLAVRWLVPRIVTRLRNALETQ